MSNYIDGFVFPIASDRLAQYTEVVADVATIWLEHGALEYHEFQGDDMFREGTSSFTEQCRENETIIFGWVVFESKQSRDEVNQRVIDDPRMTEVVAPLLDHENPVFDSSRMAYGGFKTLFSLAR